MNGRRFNKIKDEYYIDNKVYSLNYRLIDKDTVYVKHIWINYQYQGRGYLRRIFNKLVNEYNSGLVFECQDALVPMYEHIGCFCTLDNPPAFGLREMYYDPLNKMF